MGELLRKLGEVQRAEEQRLQRERAEEAARLTRLEAEARPLREETQRRAAEFIGIMTRHRVPTIPVFQRYYWAGQHGILYVKRVPDRTSSYKHLGDGWVLRGPIRPYDDPWKPGLFLTTAKDIFSIGDIQTERPSEPLHVTQNIPDGEYVLTETSVTINDGPPAEDYSPARAWATVLAGDEGLTMLAHALHRYGVAAP